MCCTQIGLSFCGGALRRLHLEYPERSAQDIDVLTGIILHPETKAPMYTTVINECGGPRAQGSEEEQQKDYPVFVAHQTEPPNSLSLVVIRNTFHWIEKQVRCLLFGSGCDDLETSYT